MKTGRSNYVKSFKVKDLEEMHMSLLGRTNIYYESHITRLQFSASGTTRRRAFS